MSVILECKDLNKMYGKKTALNNVSMSIESGRIVGILGPNGCGKTTLFKMIAGFLVDADESIKIGGHSVGPETKKIVSFSPDRIMFDSNDKISKLIEAYQYFYEDYNTEKAKNCFEKMNIDISDKIGALSKGNAEKVQIILTMSRNAGLYVLDEPFNGIDASARESIIKLLLENIDEAATVLISTHLISDIENILDEAVFMKEGQVLFHKSADDIRDEYGKSLNETFKEVFR